MGNTLELGIYAVLGTPTGNLYRELTILEAYLSNEDKTKNGHDVKAEF